MAFMVFKFLYKTAERQAEECYDSSREKSIYRFVFKDDLYKHYKAFSSISQFNAYYETIQQKHLHEVIFCGPQKIKFDVDISADKIALYKPKYDFVKTFIQYDTTSYCDCLPVNNYITILIARIECTIDNLLRGRDIPYKILVLAAHKSGVKYSFHIIVDGIAVKSNEKCNEFCKMIPDDVGFIDRNTNKKTQNFRIIYSSKLSEPDRVLVPIARIIDGVAETLPPMEHYLITNVAYCAELFDEDNVGGGEKKRGPDKMPNDVVALLKNEPEVENHIIRDYKDSIINMDRIRPSHCSQCKKMHDSDNTLFIIVKPNCCIVRCRRSSTPISILNRI